MPFREAVRSLNWVAVGTQLDTLFVVGMLSQYLEGLGHVQWESVKHIFRYLQGAKDWGLTYGGATRGNNIGWRLESLDS